MLARQEAPAKSYQNICDVSYTETITKVSELEIQIDKHSEAKKRYPTGV